MSTTETLTVIRAHGRRLAKLIRMDGTIVAYDDAKRFDLFTVPVTNLDGLHQLLQHLLHRPDCAVVRGEVADETRVRQVRRLLYEDAETGDVPTLRAMPRSWLAVDVEGVERPEGVPEADMLDCAAVALRRLPDALQGARCIILAGASHGIESDICLRLPHWSNGPADEELHTDANPDG